MKLRRIALGGALALPASWAVACGSSGAPAQPTKGPTVCTPPAPGTYQVTYASTSDAAGPCVAPLTATVTLPFDAGSGDTGVTCAAANECAQTCTGTIEGFAISATSTASVLLTGYSGTNAETTTSSDGAVISACRYSYVAEPADGGGAPFSCPAIASTFCGAARTVMGSFLASYLDADGGSPIAGGETIGREGSDTAFGTAGAVWHDACTVEMILDYYAATGDATYLPIVRAYRGFDPLDDDESPNTFNDDKLWWALALIQAYEKLPEHDPAYLTGAEEVFQNVCAQWDAHPGCSAGLTQEVSGSYVNTITNTLFFQAAVKLYFDDPADSNGLGVVTQNKVGCSTAQPWTAFTRPPAVSVGVDDAGPPPDAGSAVPLPYQFPNDYLGWALAEYEWLVTGPTPGPSFTSNAALSLPLPDGVMDASASCAPATTYWTYNSGPILGALLDLSQAPADRLPDSPDTMVELAWSIAEEAMTYFSNGSGSALYETTDPICAGGSPDCPEFKGLFTRYLARLAYGSVPSPFTARARAFLTANANAIWNNRISTTVPTSCTCVGQLKYGCDAGPGVSLPLEWNQSAPLAAQNYQQAMTSAMDALIAAIPTPSPIFAPPPLPPLQGSPARTW